MVQRQHFSFEAWSKQARIRFALLLKNRRRITTVIVGAYVAVLAVLGIALLQVFSPKPQAAQALESQISATLSANKAQIDVGQPIQLTIDIQNTGTLAPLENITVTPFSTADQLDFRSAKLDSQDGRKVGNAFVFDSLGPQVRKQIVVDTVQTRVVGNFVGVSFIITADNNEGRIESRTNRVFLGVNSVLQGGQKLDLTVPKRTFESKETEVAKVSVKNGDTQDYSGSFWLIKDEQIYAQYDCSVSLVNVCNYTLKDLPPASYNLYFATKDHAVFSNLVAFEVTTNEPRLALAQGAELLLPFGSTSIAGKLPVIIQNVVNKNQKPITCQVELQKDGEEGRKAFSTTSNLLRNCEFWISTAELNGFGAYTLTIPSTDIKKSLVITENTTRLPLSVQNTVIVKGQPVTLFSEGVNSLVQTNTPYEGQATLLLYNPFAHELSQTTTISQIPITYSTGKLELELPPSLLSESQVYYTAIEIKEVNQQQTLQRISDWTVINFASQSIDVPQSGIEIEDMNQLRVGGKPSFVVKNITDASGSVVNNRSCTLTVLTSGASKTVTKSSNIIDGMCKVVLEDADLTQTGVALATFVTNDTTTSVPVSRVVEIESGAIRSIGSITPIANPIPRNTATQLLVGPVRDAKDNLITSASLTFLAGQEPGVWSFQQSIWVKDGFGTVILPSSLTDDKAVYTRLQQKEDEPLLDKTFETGNPTQTKFTLPNTVATGQGYSAELENIDSNQLECVLTLKGVNEKTATAPVDLASKTCATTSESPSFGTQFLATLTLGETSFSQLVHVQSSDAVNNFGLYPHTQQNEFGEVSLRLVSSPIVDSAGLAVLNGTLNLKINGRDTSARVEDGIATFVLSEEFATNKDIRTVRGLRLLDLDIEGQVSARAQISNTNIRIILGSRDLTHEQMRISIEHYQSVQNVNTVQLIRLKSPSCEAWYQGKNGYEKLQSVQIEKECYLWLSQSEQQTGYVVILHKGNELARMQVNFVENAPIVVWNTEEKVTPQLISEENYDIRVTLFDDEKEYTYDTSSYNNQTAVIEQQGLVDNASYLVRLEALHNDGSVYYFYSTFTGEQLR